MHRAGKVSSICLFEKMRIFRQRQTAGVRKLQKVYVYSSWKVLGMCRLKISDVAVKTDDGYGEMSKTLHILAAYALFLLRRYVL